MTNDIPPIRDLSKPTRDTFEDLFREKLQERMQEKQINIQKITQMKFHDFKHTEYVKSNIKVNIGSNEKFSRKEIEQKELILKALTEKLQQKLTTYEKDTHDQKLLLKEEEQKKEISQELNRIVSKNYKQESEKLLQILSDKMNLNIVPAIATINQILETNIVDENKKEDLEIIKTNLFEFLNDASQIAEYQRLVQDEKSIHKTIVNVNDIIKKIMTKQKPLADKKGISLNVENYDVTTIFCDEYRISFVLNTLIKNSINSCDINGEIKIIFSDSEKGVSIAVIDNGKGFTPEFVDEVLFSTKKVLDPFANENQFKANMMVSRIIVNNHQGEFNIISQLGQKTEISFNLPTQKKFSTSQK